MSEGKTVHRPPLVTREKPSGLTVAAVLARAGTALGYSAVVVVSLWMGPVAAGIAFGAMAGVAAAEFFAITRRESRLPNEAFGVVASAAMPIAAAVWGMSGLSAVLTALIAGSLVWHTLFRRTRTADTAITVFGAVYTGFLLAYLVLVLKTFEAGRWLALLLVFSVWANDVVAYLVGSAFGRHKLAPHISPKKSWEGFLAGSAASIAVWWSSVLFPAVGLTASTAVLTGVAVALSAVIGDLTESRMKREAGVKDSGTLLPGHGGFLDRLDSLILVCLVTYWVLWWGGVR